MKIALWVFSIAENPDMKLSEIRVATYLARNADESGSFPSPEKVEPPHIAKTLGIGIASVYRALSALDLDNYLNWYRAPDIERFSGAVGRLRLNLDHGEG